MASSSTALTLEILPESELQFNLSSAEATPRCSMILRHPGNHQEHVAFKVKTTQPRRYLVRPNQGLIGPGGQETVQILLVEKDKFALLQSYERLGQTALDHSKDKFLVQTCAVTAQFCAQYQNSPAGYESLTTMWTQVTSGGGSANSMPVSNKKLHVRHVVVQAGEDKSNAAGGAAGNAAKPATGAAAGASGTSALPAKHEMNTPMESMSQEQLVVELNNLRRKYDELVAFSVNLTAERDILNNTLEQTKRDLNRQVQKTTGGAGGAGGDAAGSAAGGTGGSGGGKAGVLSYIILFAVLLLGVWMGVRLEQADGTGIIKRLPVVGNLLGGGGDGGPVDPPAGGEPDL